MSRRGAPRALVIDQQRRPEHPAVVSRYGRYVYVLEHAAPTDLAIDDAVEKYSSCQAKIRCLGQLPQVPQEVKDDGFGRLLQRRCDIEVDLLQRFLTITFPYSQEISASILIAVSGLEHHRRPVRTVSPIGRRRMRFFECGANRLGSP